MHSLQRVVTSSQIHRLASAIVNRSLTRGLSSARDGDGGGDRDWNDAWETAWLPEDAVARSRPPWESDVNFSLDADAEARAFIEDMDENWTERRGTSTKKKEKEKEKEKEKKAQTPEKESESLYGLERMKKDYRLKKQRIHATLWTKEIEKQEEARLAGDGGSVAGDDIEKLLDRCSDIFDSANAEFDDERTLSSSSEFKANPDGWETTSKSEDGNVWEMTQREEDILLQEFERRIAYSKFQIASFIKTHIFSRRRPIDGWKYMIEELGPNARRGKGKGSVSRLPTLSDSSTQPFKEENTPLASNSLEPFRRR